MDTSFLGGRFWQALGQGQRGVDLFFVLSGFLITGILIETRSAPHFFRDFYVRRALRIFPLYYGILAVCFWLLPASIDYYRETAPDQIWLWLYGANILQAQRADWALGYFEHFWSLAVEEHYYLVWPFIIWWCSRQQAIVVCWLMIVLAPVCRWICLIQLGNPVAMEVLTPCRLDALALGGLLSLWARQPSGASPGKLSWICCLALGCAPLALLAVKRQWFAPLAYTVVAGWCGILILTALHARPGSWLLRIWGNAPLRLLGTCSYGMYVLQLPIKPWLPGWMSAETLTVQLGSAFLGRSAHMLMATALTFALAMASWHLMEKHFLALKDRLAPRHRP